MISLPEKNNHHVSTLKLMNEPDLIKVIIDLYSLLEKVLELEKIGNKKLRKDIIEILQKFKDI
jgi:hypothetical protein